MPFAVNSCVFVGILNFLRRYRQISTGRGKTVCFAVAGRTGQQLTLCRFLGRGAISVFSDCVKSRVFR